MKTRIIWLATLALLAALVISGTAFAEGEVPLPSGAEESPATTGDPAAVEEALPPDPVIPAEATPEEVAEAVAKAPAVDEPAVPVVAEPIAAAPAADVSLPAAEVLSVLSEEAILVDAEGEPLVMASEESAEILAAADPFFISGGTTYSFYQAAGACAGAPNCFDGLSNPIQYAIDYIQLNATLPDDGRIYVEKATYTGAVTVDGSLANLNSLTGLIGLPTAGLFPTISSTLTLKNLTIGFSLMGFNVTGGITVQNSSGQFKFDTVSGNLTMDTVDASGSTGHGIHIKNHKGNIVLQGVTSSNNTSAGRGVWVENQLLGNVTINDSTFENNASHGIKLGAKGVITIDGVHTNSNNIGIVVDTCSALTIKNTEANNNRTAGIWAEPVGKPVTLENVTANQNGADYFLNGIHLLNVGNVNAKNITANQNYGDGLHIESPGTVTLNSVMANENTHYGINIDHGPSGSVVNMNGVVANNNNTGIYVRSKGATIKNVSANNNLYVGLAVDIVGGTTLLENVVANNNGDFVEPFDGGDNELGIYIYAYPGATSTVTLKNVTASNNEDGGVVADILGIINIYNTSTDNNPNGDGTYIETNGAVTITSLGAFSNGKNGLYVRTKGAITITGIYAGNNGFSGADLDNGLCTYDNINLRWTCLGTGAIQVKNTSDRLNDLSSNNHFGLWAVSKGAITITNLRATDNDSDGAYLTNRFGGSTAGITVNTLGAVYNEFSNNGWYEVFQPDTDDYYQVLANGLSALSAGNISVTNTDAWQNHSGGGGIYLDSKFSTAARSVTLSNSTARDNDWVGVWVYSRGNITLTNVVANDNHTEAGIHVNNCLDRFYGSEDNICSSTGTVLLTNIIANRNSGTGIQALSKGTITLNGANSSRNWDMGISLINNFTGATAGVSLTNINANDNNNTGLSVTTNGSATLTGINTHNNAMTHGGMGSGETTVQDFFNQSHGPDSWWFDAEYDVTYTFTLLADAGWDLNRVDFDPWIELYDSDDESSPIDISGTLDCTENVSCEFSFNPEDLGFSETHTFYVLVGSNTNDGFYRLSLNDEDPSDSTNYFWVSGTGVTAGGNISVNAIESHSNELIGLGATVMGNGAITLSNLHISDNGSEGIYLTCGQDPNDFNNSGFGTGSISLSGINAISYNGWDGLIMATSGNVTLSNLEATGNGQPTRSNGISIRDDHAAKAVTLSGISAGDNGQWGLWFIATGNMSLTNVDVWQNQNEGGIFLDNCVDELDGTIDGICMGTGTIRLTTVNSDANQGKGIEIFSKGLITLSGVHTKNNWQTGIRAINDFTMTTSGITLSNVRAESNGDSGITAKTNGALLMSNINANNNMMVERGLDAGTSVQGYYNEGSGPDKWWFYAEEGIPYTLVMHKDAEELINRYPFDPFMTLYDEGENYISNGTMYTSYYQIDFTPSSSGMYYLEVSNSLDNDDINSGFYRLAVNDNGLEHLTKFWVDGLMYDAGGNVTLSGTNSFSNNETAGLIGWSKGNTTLANFFAWGNGTEGIYIDNTDGSGNILINGTNAAGGNGWEGLRIMTNGAVSVSNLEANNNGQDGIRIAANTALKAVTLNNIVAMWNGISGIEMQTDGGTHGLTTLNNVRAWFNTEDGANVDTNGYSLTLLNSSFMCNDDDGFVYWGYPPLFVFTNTSNIFIGNGGDNLLVKY